MKVNYMKSNLILWSLVAIGASLFSACKKDNDPTLPAPIKLSIESENVSINMSDTLKITSKVLDDQAFEYEWKVNDSLVSIADSLVFTSYLSGNHNISFKAYNTKTSFTKTLKLEIKEIALTEGSNNAYVTKLFGFVPAPGQFINKAPGNLISAQGILGKKGMVSLGAWGGYIVLGFDHTVANQADKDDIIIYGNPSAQSAEPGVIWVMNDENKNGKPDDTWYEIAGSEFDKTGYIRNYAVTYTRPNPLTSDVAWKDNKGNNGVVKTNTYHKQPYFPEWLAGNSYTISGTLLPSSNINMSNPSFITSAPFAFGYADNTVGGDKIDLSLAVDSQGKKVNLSGIDFIKIQTGVQANMGWLGELSTEVIGVADLSLVNK